MRPHVPLLLVVALAALGHAPALGQQPYYQGTNPNQLLLQLQYQAQQRLQFDRFSRVTGRPIADAYNPFLVPSRSFLAPSNSFLYPRSSFLTPSRTFPRQPGIPYLVPVPFGSPVFLSLPPPQPPTLEDWDFNSFHRMPRDRRLRRE